MGLGSGDVLLVNLASGEYMVADHYALLGRGMPDSYEQAENVSNQGWLDAIARAAGEGPFTMPEPGRDEDVLVELATGRSWTQHKAITAGQGVGHGCSDLDRVGRLDFLDALRSLKGLAPCDRAALGEEPSPDAETSEGFGP